MYIELIGVVTILNSQKCRKLTQPVCTYAHLRVGESNDRSTNTHIVFMHVFGKKRIYNLRQYIHTYWTKLLLEAQPNDS